VARAPRKRNKVAAWTGPTAPAGWTTEFIPRARISSDARRRHRATVGFTDTPSVESYEPSEPQLPPRQLPSRVGAQFNSENTDPKWLSPQPEPKRAPRTRQRTKAVQRSRSVKTLTIKDREQAIYYSRGLIAVFQEAAEYDRRRSNEKPPALWVDDERYLLDVREILSELRKIVTLLEATAKPVKAVPVQKTARRFGKFIDTYQNTLGHTLAVLTTMGIASWMVHVGLLPSEFPQIATLLKRK
jgi:hypothetical protein